MLKTRVVFNFRTFRFFSLLFQQQYFPVIFREGAPGFEGGQDPLLSRGVKLCPPCIILGQNQNKIRFLRNNFDH